jgi:hypothetical protein
MSIAITSKRLADGYVMVRYFGYGPTEEMSPTAKAAGRMRRLPMLLAPSQGKYGRHFSA